MKIAEIPQDAPIMLEICKEKQTVEVCVEIDRKIEKGIILKPIVIDGKMLNLNDDEIKLRLIYEREGDKPLIWRNVAYETIRQENRPYVMLMDARDGMEHNRRKTYRLDMDVQGTLNKSEKIVIHDISGAGISFYTPLTSALEVGSEVRIRFMGGYEEIAVSARVVRRTECDDRMLHGCVSKANLQVEKFISEEQVKRARKRR